MGRPFVLAATCVLVLSANARSQESVDDLVTKLASDDAAQVVSAIEAVAALGSGGAKAVPALTGHLASKNADVRWQAARALGAIGGEEAAAATAALAKALAGDEDGKTRAYAAYALGQIGKPAESAVDTLIDKTFDEDPLVRRASLRALRAIDPPQDKTLPMVLKILETGDMTVIGPALASLAEEGEKVVPRLRKAFETPAARYWACLVLADIGVDARAAVPELTGALKDESPDVRLQALVALGEIGSHAEASLPAVVDRFSNDEFDVVRYAAGYALGKIGTKGDAAAVLTAALDSDDEFLRTVSAWALARNNPDDEELVNRAVKLIVNAFKSEDVNVRRAAARAVVEFDVPPETVAPALVAALDDKDPAVVSNAIQALAGLGPKALKHVGEALKNGDLRHYAVRLIVEMGPEAAPALPALIAASQVPPQNEGDVEFVREVQLAIGRIGPPAGPAVPALVRSLSSNEVEIQASAAYALGKIGPLARPAVPALRRSLRSNDPIVKLASVRALLEIQPREPSLGLIAIPMMLKAVESENPLVQAEAASALAKLGRLGQALLPKIKELAEHENPLVSRAAAEALKAAGQ